MKSIETYKEIIPEFVIKLYHILEKNQFKDFICWAEEGTEILIRNPKKLEEKVLPHFFRHRHISSFIRQLNMYKFSKVNKISKERSHMYFKNDHFQRGNMDQMKLIRRNTKPKKCSKQTVSLNGESQSFQPELSAPSIAQLKHQTQAKFKQIEKMIDGIIQKHPQVKKELTPAIRICQQERSATSLYQYSPENSMIEFLPEQNQEEKQSRNLLGMNGREFPSLLMNSLILPSICSLTNLDC